MYIRHPDIISVKPIIFLHGFLESGDIWLPWVTRTKWNSSLVIPDLPGHGKSEAWTGNNRFAGWAAYLVNYMDNLTGRKNKFDLVAHSMGGYLALEMAALFPQRMHKVVLFHSTPFPDQPGQVLRRKKQINVIEKGRSHLMTKDVGPAMFAVENRERLHLKGQELNKIARQCSDIGMVNALNAIMTRRNFISILQEKMDDCMLVTGGYDPFMPGDHVEKIIKGFPDLSHVHFAECGHAAFLEAPEDSIDIIIRFLEGKIKPGYKMRVE